ncbi:MAG: monovalent cation/H(+) antiporter subunit G [Candidatus Aenigmarchaeota archaeon]|nr:monovalent cation/H(+) antiporter subunit G [Candidatus Aenigmarchaeota archaeon]
MIEIIVQVMLYIAGIFAIIGSLGLIRFPDFYTRTHAATMISVGSISLGLLALILSAGWGVYSMKIFIVIVFNLFTNPTATHAIAEKAYKMGIKPKNLVKDEMKI